MSGSSSTTAFGVKARRPVEDRGRPISAALPLGREHFELIENSHERCAALGVLRGARPVFASIDRADLAIVRERNLPLQSHATPIMEMLYEHLSNTGCMVLLSDATGTILQTIADEDFLAKAAKVALEPGANWSEAAKGTNAIGTALVTETPTLVYADEHYMRVHHFLTCSAAPVLDPRGNILGVIACASDHRSYHPHTMALLKMSARMIENHWLSDDCRNVMQLHFHSHAEFIGTLMEGILAINPEGKVVSANRGAMEQLGMSGATLRMNTVTSMFATTSAALADHFGSALAAPMPVEMSNGRKLYLQARLNWSVWNNLAQHSSDSSEDFAPDSAHAFQNIPTQVNANAEAITRGERGGLKSLQTNDPQISNVVAKIQRVLNRDIPILILGETGTGKELLARAIHQDCDRSHQAFIAVNCSSIPETLILADLFGYEEGAFTGTRRKGAVGKIVQANGGTLFFDEIGDMPLAIQAHLLRVLQDRQVTPLGSMKSIPIDVKIICATHRNLREMIERKEFRQDLYYRLNGLAVRLPALRERADLPTLVTSILERECPGRHLQLASNVLRLFQSCRWPGNVRQLFNVLRTAAIMASNDRIITTDHLSDDFFEDAQLALAALEQINRSANISGSDSSPMKAAQAAHEVSSGEHSGNPFRTLEEVEVDTIRCAVDAAGGNISEASKRLGVSRNTVYRKLRWVTPRSE